MYIHISPKFINHSNTPIILDEFTININQEIFTLKKEHLKVFSPFSNKKYLVACKKQRKNTIGFLFKTNQNVKSLTTTAIWQNLANGTDFKHTVNYELINHSNRQEDLLISNEVALWLENECYQNKVPLNLAESIISKFGLNSIYYFPYISDNLTTVNKDSEYCIQGNTVEIQELFKIPTLELMRLIDYKNSNTDVLLNKIGYLKKLPGLDKAISL